MCRSFVDPRTHPVDRPFPRIEVPARFGFVTPPPAGDDNTGRTAFCLGGVAPFGIEDERSELIDMVTVTGVDSLDPTDVAFAR